MVRLLLALLAVGVLAPQARAEPSDERLKALGLSLLLPGLGHRSIGETGRSQAFLVGEASLWGAYTFFHLQGNRREERYLEFAEIFAGIEDARNRSSQYYRNLGRYQTSDDYDEVILREARARYGDDLEGRETYFLAHRVPEDQAWKWSSRQAQDSYRRRRSASNLSFKRAETMLGIAVANRLLASLDTIRILRNRSLADPISLRIAIDPFDPNEPPRFCLTIPLP